jgi:hypothetical protein
MPLAATIERRPERCRHRAPFRVETTEPAASVRTDGAARCGSGRVLDVSVGVEQVRWTVARRGHQVRHAGADALLRVLVASDFLTSMCSRFWPPS